ncbi:TRAP transporter small permease [Tistrella mobilis]|uniref:TRAP transporter small permease n=1 Tax=Tistrella mobilis TaxID=171437 RepID=UPI0035588F23
MPRLMRILNLLAARAATATGALGELAVLAMFAHMALDLIIRLVGGGTPEGMPEAVARIYMVMVVFLPLAGLQASGRQIEVAVLAERLGGRALYLQRLAAALVTVAVAGLFTWLSFDVAWVATLRGERVVLTGFSLPVWPGRWAVVAGFGALALVAVAQLVRVAAGREPVELAHGG